MLFNMATFEFKQLIHDWYLNTQVISRRIQLQETHTYSEVTELVVNWTEAEHGYVYSIKPGLYSTVIDTH